MVKKIGKNTPKSKELKKESTSNVFSRTGKKIDEIEKVLGYKIPDYNSIVDLKGGDEVKELKNEKFIDENNFRLQIGKMQEDGNTIYSPLMLRFGLEYIANHIKLDENGRGKAIIQLWPDLAQCLLQEEKEILSFEEEEKEIKKLAKKILGKRSEMIKIENVADNYPDVFKAIKNGRRGIIPNEEPQLKNLNIPLESPLPIIKFLAYRAKNDPDLMDVFYKTKPAKYIGQDVMNNRKAGEFDSDYYSIVEVGIRLFEVLNGKYIQGGIGRQRVYDKIISLIIFGKDKIGKAEEYGANTVLKLDAYPALKNLHNWLVKNGLCDNIKMGQLYIELNENSLDKIESNLNKKEKLKSKLIKIGTGLALFSTLALGGGYIVNDIIANKRSQRERDQLSNHEKTFYSQETNELISALSLNKLGDDNHKQAIIDLFNIYVGDHKTDGSTNAELIQGFWQKYLLILIKDFKLKHPPYDFMDKELINLTNKITDELSYTPEYKIGSRIRSDKFYDDYGVFYTSSIGHTRDKYKMIKYGFEYNDNGKSYLILEVRIYVGGTKISIYVATPKDDYSTTFSTETLKKIQDKSGLDPDILVNTNNLKGNFILYDAHIGSNGYHDGSIGNSSSPLLENADQNQIIEMSNLQKSRLIPKNLYLGNGELYYIIKIPTRLGKYIGLASKSIDGTYTTTEFNRVAKQFSKERNLLRDF